MPLILLQCKGHFCENKAAWSAFTSSAYSCAPHKSLQLGCDRAVVTAARPAAGPQGVILTLPGQARGHGDGELARNSSLGSYQKTLNQHKRGLFTCSAKVFMARGDLPSKKNKGLKVELLSWISVYVAFLEPHFEYTICAILKLIVSSSGWLEKDGIYSFEPLIS